ncbi:hypothetical protein LV779_34480 [Streptomyces thinghirensis]|nr:hypothetical protein [Streptomyces thinghirensis]
MGTAIAARTRTRGTDIAIVGVGGHATRWRRTSTSSPAEPALGRDCVTEIPRTAGTPVTTRSTTRWGGFLDGVDRFDPLFFRISPREQVLDQERLFLESVRPRTLEDAGYYQPETLSPASPPGPTARAWSPHRQVGVFVGVMYEEYQLSAPGAGAQPPSGALGQPSSIANRVCILLPTTTARAWPWTPLCSSSLTPAIHLACEAIEETASAQQPSRAASTSASANKYVMLSRGKFTSSDGRCPRFGEGGDDYVPGGGVGAVPAQPAGPDPSPTATRIRAASSRARPSTTAAGPTASSVPNPAAQGDVIRPARSRRRCRTTRAEAIWRRTARTHLPRRPHIELTGLVKSVRAEDGEAEAAPTCAIPAR